MDAERKFHMIKCEDCNGTGWIGHGMGGDTCGKCSGKGEVPLTRPGVPGCPHCGYRHPPDGTCI